MHQPDNPACVAGVEWLVCVCVCQFVWVCMCVCVCVCVCVDTNMSCLSKLDTDKWEISWKIG